MPPLLAMSDMKPKGVKLTLGKKEYGLRFTINAIDAIQDHFNIDITGLRQVLEPGKNRIKNLRWLLTLLINENILCENDENPDGSKQLLLEEEYVGRMLSLADLARINQSIRSAVVETMPEADDDEDGDGEEDPNVTSG